MDRTHDLVSPIIHELYYQAMVEDLVRPPNDVYKYALFASSLSIVLSLICFSHLQVSLQGFLWTEPELRRHSERERPHFLHHAPPAH